MEKEDLINGIYDFNKDLKECIQQTKSDIDFNKDILSVNIKHRRDKEGIERKIDELEIILRTLQQIENVLTDDLSENNIEIEDIIEYCED